MLRISAFVFAALFVGIYAEEANEHTQKLAEEAFYAKSGGPSAASKCGRDEDTKVHVKVNSFERDVSSGAVLYTMKVDLIVDLESTVPGSTTKGEYLNRTFKVTETRSGTIIVQENPCDNLPKDFDALSAVL